MVRGQVGLSEWASQSRWEAGESMGEGMSVQVNGDEIHYVCF